MNVPQPPVPPLDRYLKEGVGHFCSICGSTSSRKGWLGLFGKRSCDNPNCPNAKK